MPKNFSKKSKDTKPENHGKDVKVSILVPIAVIVLMVTSLIAIVFVAVLSPEQAAMIGTAIIAFTTMGVTQLFTLFKLQAVEHQTNSMKDELVEATRKGAFAAGKKEEEAEEDDRRDKAKGTESKKGKDEEEEDPSKIKIDVEQEGHEIKGTLEGVITLDTEEDEEEKDD